MIEAWGRGIERIMEGCAAAGAPEPEIRNESTGLWTVFPFAPKHVAREVTGEIEKLLLALTGEMKRSEIQEALGLRHEEHFREAYLVPALQAILVEMTRPDRPKSRLQKYRLTARGAALRAKLTAA